MIKHRGIITGFTFLTMFFIGVGTTVIGAASKNIGLSPDQIGLMMALQNVGFLIALLIAGALADTVRKPLLISGASLILGTAFLFFYRSSGFAVNLIIMSAIGLGMGTYEGTADALLLDIHDKRENMYVTINHFFVTFGSLIITFYLIFLQMRWRRAIVQAAVAVFVIALLFVLSKPGRRTGTVKKLADRFKLIRKERGTGVFFILILCGVGIELGVMGILTSFLVDLRGFNLVTSKLGLIVEIGGAAVGRVLIGFLSKNENIRSYLVGLYALSAVFAGLVFFLPLGMIPVFILLFFLGLSLSGILPLVITMTGLRYKDIAGTVLGIVKLGIPVGGILIPFLLSVLARWGSFQLSLLLFPLCGVTGLVLMLAYKRRLIFSA